MSRCYPGRETAWVIRVRETNERCVDMTVRAQSYEDAMAVGERAIVESIVPWEHRVRVDVKAQNGEPWVYFYNSEDGWYDLHGPGDIIVMERALGHTFTQYDVDVLRERIESIGLTVASGWNGEGCDTVSFRCQGRPNGKDPLTAEQKAILTAPRSGIPWTIEE